VKDFVRDYIVPQTTEFIDKYDPDIFWGDYDWMTPAESNGSYDIVAYLYNHAEGRKEVATNDRLGKARPEEIKGRFTKRPREWLRTVRGDFYTDEWGDTEECLDPAKWHPWESCSGISKAYGNHWQETADMVMTEREFVIHFADIVARGGNLLLLVNLDPQGEIPAVQRERLLQIGNWLKRYGEAIYATRILAPFKTDAVDYTQSKDGKSAYAIVKKPAATVTLACAVPDGAKVTVIGDGTPLKAEKGADGLTVHLPPAYATAEIPFALKASR
jgi:alpha-L-fucosidase